jgi:RND family efflux transporter MFP subunit
VVIAMQLIRNPLTALGAAVLIAAAGCGRDIESQPASSAAPALADSPPMLADSPPSSLTVSATAPLPAERRAGHLPMTLPAVLYSERDAELRVRVDGVVGTITAELGDRVRAGQLLAVLVDAEEASVLAAARATAEHAARVHDRALALRAQDGITEAELDQERYRLRAAEAALQAAQVRHEYTRIRAPFDGVVTRRFIRVGQSLETGDPLFRVTALHPLRAQVRVPEHEAAGLAVAQPVLVRGVHGATAEGVILRIAPAVDALSGTVEVLVDIVQPAGLRPGSAVQVELEHMPRAGGDGR